MAQRRISPMISGLLLIVLAAFGPLANQAGIGELLAAGLLRMGGQAAPAAPTHLLYSEISRYLENDFCRDGLCPAGGWPQWIIIDEQSDWTLGQLQTVRRALVETIAALDEVGMNGRRLLAGYRFRYQPGETIAGRPNSVALVRHEHQEIILTDAAFRLENGFSIYHELGHVVDNRLRRRLTSGFMEITGSGDDYRRETGMRVTQGYWVRTQTSHSPYEATADAFAVWVTVVHLQAAGPAFRTTPEDVNFQAIGTAVEASLRVAEGEQN